MCLSQYFNDRLEVDESYGETIYNTIRRIPQDRICCVDAATNEEHTYKSLQQWSIKLAIHLKEKGVKKGDSIAILSDISVNTIVAYIASFYVGAIVCPLNPQYSLDELKHGLSISKPSSIICITKVSKKVEEVKQVLDFIKNIILLDDENEKISIFDNLINSNGIMESFRPERIDPHEVAAIFTSSGTTGVPKGVLVTHNHLKFSFTYTRDPEFLDSCYDDNTLICFPLFHILGYNVSMMAMLHGIKQVLMDTFKPTIYLEAIQKYKIVKLYVVPPLLLFLSKSPVVDKYDISSVEDIICSGGPTGKDVEELARKRFPSASVRQMYGLTEATGAITITPPGNGVYGSVGKSIRGCEIRVVDIDTSQVLPANNTGEICFKSPALMKGYIPEEIRDDMDQDGFLHTGDVGYFDDEGYFYIVDRIKELIKYKGFQVAPASLESILMKHPKVLDAAVVGKEDPSSGELPVAFVVKAKNVDAVEQEFIDYVAEHVSKQSQLHGGVKFIDEIPKNASGKILRKHLRDMLIHDE